MLSLGRTGTWLLFALAVAKVAHGLECSWSSGVPCSFGACTFDVAGGTLRRLGTTCTGSPGVLSLSNKGITSLSPDVFVALEDVTVLRLDYNVISVLPPLVFHHLVSLKILNLQNNRLVELPEGIFDELTSLEDLHLDGNRFSSLPYVFSGLTRLKHVSTADNPSLRCLPMVKDERDRLAIYTFEPDGPEELCQPCGDGLTYPRGCKCEPGRTGRDGGPCAQCATGKVKAGRGNQPCMPCPTNSTSTAQQTGCRCVRGFVQSNVSGVCEPSSVTPQQAGGYKVRLVLQLPMSEMAFKEKQDSFIEAVASAAGVSVEDVAIDVVTPVATRRRLLQTADSVRVEVSVMVADQEAGDALTLTAVNRALLRKGLPRATLVEGASKSKSTGGASTTSSPEASSTGSTAFIAGAAGGAVCICLCCAAGAGAYDYYNPAIPRATSSQSAPPSSRTPKASNAGTRAAAPTPPSATAAVGFVPPGKPDHTLRPSLQEPSATMRYPSEDLLSARSQV